MFDIKFVNASIIDGSGTAIYVSDVGIIGERIVEIGAHIKTKAKQTIDISGKILCPGFIDVHTHDDNAILKSPEALPKISQGVTTIIVGNCGISLAPTQIRDHVPDPLNLLGRKEEFQFPNFKTYIDQIKVVKPAINVAALCGHMSLRTNAMRDTDRECTLDELEQMKAQLQLAIKEGAIGLSTGLAYGTSFKSSTEEVVELAKVVAKGGGIYTTHLRNEFELIIEALEESYEICEAANLPMLISHLKCAGIENWGRSKQVLQSIKSAKCADSIHTDCYPYIAGSSTLDLKQVDEKVEILITWSDPHPSIAPKYLSEISKEWNISQLEAAKKLQPAGAVYFSMDEEDMRRILCDEKTMIGSDGLPHDPHPHPRLYGTFPRVIGKYSRDYKLLSLEEAIRKMTSMPAKKFQFKNRGEIRVGNYADLVIFNFETIDDKASYEDPKQLASGIDYVLVNGQMSFENGKVTSKRSGRYLRPNKE